MDRIVRFLPSIFAGVLCLLPFAPEALAADRKDTRPVLDPPPPALPQSFTVPRGTKLDIPLRIYGVQNEPLRYLIRSAPLHGKITDPRVVSREVSQVTYEPPSDLAVSADRFTYSVQSHAGVSAPVEVTIAITDLPPRFAVPATVEFGELLAGETAVREIEVSNRGGGRIEGTVEVDPPLRIEGRSSYRLEAGDYTYFKIIFAPTEGGIFRREIRYTSDRNFVTSVSGSAQSPVSAEPAKVELRHEPESAIRTGAFEVVNRTNDERTFEISGGPRLQLPTTITVPPRGRVPVAVNTRADDVAAIEDTEIRVQSSGFALVIPVHAATVGPILRLPNASVGLGRIDALRGTQSSVEVENIGGTLAQVTAEIGAPFFLPETSFNILPGEKKRVVLKIAPGEPKRYRTWLKLKAGVTSAELEVEAELIGSMLASSPDGARSSDSAKPKPKTDLADLPPWMPDLELAKTIRVTAVAPTSADVEWPLEMNGAKAFRVQRLMLTRDTSHELRNVWLEIPGTRFTQRPPYWVASLTSLEPNQSQTVRVVPVDGEGQPGEPLFQLDFYTPPRTSVVPRPRMVPTLFLIAAGIGGFLLFRRLRRHYTEPISGF